jgi:hypothetical protein
VGHSEVSGGGQNWRLQLQDSVHNGGGEAAGDWILQLQDSVHNGGGEEESGGKTALPTTFLPASGRGGASPAACIVYIHPLCIVRNDGDAMTVTVFGLAVAFISQSSSATWLDPTVTHTVLSDLHGHRRPSIDV